MKVNKVSLSTIWDHITESGHAALLEDFSVLDRKATSDFDLSISEFFLLIYLCFVVVLSLPSKTLTLTLFQSFILLALLALSLSLHEGCANMKDVQTRKMCKHEGCANMKDVQTYTFNRVLFLEI